MKKAILILGMVLCCFHWVYSSSGSIDSLDYVHHVNPLIGTDFKGNTYPGAQVPFGMVQLSPDNGIGGWDRISGYFYPDSTIAGFSHTHLSGTGAGDLYDISFFPVTLPYKESLVGDLGIYSTFSHKNEIAYAGYYKVLLTDYNIQVELTSTPRVGLQRYTFPKAQAIVQLNLKKAMNWDITLDTKLEQVDSCTVQGYRYSDGWARGQKVYFVSRFSRAFDSLSIDSTVISKNGHRGMAHVARFYFSTEEDEQITVSTALSGVSVAGAMANLQVESPHPDFDAALEKAIDSWNSALRKVEVEGGSNDERKIFYTALYHSELAPTIYSDTNGDYYGPDHQIHKIERGVNYSTFSLWDTYRAAHPLYTLIETDRVNDMVKSFLLFYEQNGRLPVWNFWGSETDMMIGYHAVPVIADACLKKIGDFDREKALNACVVTANIDSYRGIGLYKKKGYVPYDSLDGTMAEKWSLSRTLEYAYDDACIAKMAKQMGKIDIAKNFSRRANHYKNVFNAVTGFFQPRNYKGDFLFNFDPEDYSDHICESNAWQYLWSVQHDIDGLIDLLGGKSACIERLDSLFVKCPSDTSKLPLFSTGMIGQYVHGNEPCHHVAYIYNRLYEPWKTQNVVDRIRGELYSSHPDGLCGNEDCGQMSAWYVLSAMGLYPLDPVGGDFEICAPIFTKVVIHLENGKVFTLLAPRKSSKHKYIKSVRINGHLHHSSFVNYKQIMEGATIELEMTDEEGICWYGHN